MSLIQLTGQFPLEVLQNAPMVEYALSLVWIVLMNVFSC